MDKYWDSYIRVQQNPAKFIWKTFMNDFIKEFNGKKTVIVLACQSWWFHKLADETTTIITSAQKRTSQWTSYTTTGSTYALAKILDKSPNILIKNLEKPLRKVTTKRPFINDAPKVSWWNPNDKFIINVD